MLYNLLTIFLTLFPQTFLNRSLYHNDFLKTATQWTCKHQTFSRTNKNILRQHRSQPTVCHNAIALTKTMKYNPNMAIVSNEWQDKEIVYMSKHGYHDIARVYVYWHSVLSSEQTESTQNNWKQNHYYFIDYRTSVLLCLSNTSQHDVIRELFSFWFKNFQQNDSRVTKQIFKQELLDSKN